MIDYVESSLQKYDSGRALACQNDRCALYNKTIFRVVKIDIRVDHKTIRWLCGRCQTQQTIKESNY